LIYPLLNFRVEVGQRSFRIQGAKDIGRSLFLAAVCRIAGILVNRSWDKRGLTV